MRPLPTIRRPRHPARALLAALVTVLQTAMAPLTAFAQETAPAPEIILPAITVAAVTPQTLTDEIVTSGLVTPVEMVNVAPLVEGQQIEALLADVGDRVTAGQVLARLSRSSLDLQKAQLAASLAAARAAIAQGQAQLTQAQSSADEAARSNARTLALKEQGSASQSAADKSNAAAVAATAQLAVAQQGLESAKANLALVQAQLANVDLSLARTNVTAPFAGEITARNATLGAVASAAGLPMFTLIRDGALELRADVSEADLLRLAPGLPATLSFTTANTTAQMAAPALSGTVRLVEPTIDSATRLGRVRIAVDPGANLRAGMFAQATIQVAQVTALAVPVTALSTNADGQSSVTIVVDGVAQRQTVTTGIRDHGWVEVTSGLSEGQLVVTKAGAFVREGDHIRPVTAAEMAAASAPDATN